MLVGMTVTHFRSPVTVHTSFLLWMGALAAGCAEMLLHDADIAGVALRLTVYAVVVAVALRMRAGRNWARWVLAAGLGVVGTLSLVIDPVTWLLDGNSLVDAARRADLTGALVAVSRTLHVLCVWVAVPLMFGRRANAYFSGRWPSGSVKFGHGEPTTADHR
ncbi:hypothetical protein Ari01nite_59840 [Paractinoplanes rishiriensis]|uniref:Uncharacterized protein n=2 Tax=Paractinoplanes rishiriensis TaxID=1050105 RepID=A0A919K2X7_9ACTN|nr:hypothetical protein Ari01nite_59840 [Actinoplanes rishiriensis]